MIEQAPERLVEVPSVGRKRAAIIVQAWAEQRAIKEVMLFLQSYGVSTSLATKIYKQYGDAAIATVKDDPYRLARDIFGIGFVTADKIAQAMGLPADAPQRVAAGVAYALNEASEQGHVFLPTPELVKLTARIAGRDARSGGPRHRAPVGRRPGQGRPDAWRRSHCPGAAPRPPPFAARRD